MPGRRNSPGPSKAQLIMSDGEFRWSAGWIQTGSWGEGRRGSGGRLYKVEDHAGVATARRLPGDDGLHFRVIQALPGQFWCFVYESEMLAVSWRRGLCWWSR